MSYVPSVQVTAILKFPIASNSLVAGYGLNPFAGFEVISIDPLAASFPHDPTKGALRFDVGWFGKKRF